MKPFKKFMKMIPAPVKKFAGPVIAVDTGAEIFNQGKEGSLVNQGVNALAKQNNKVPFLPKAGADPKTDIGKRSSEYLMKKIKSIKIGKKK